MAKLGKRMRANYENWDPAVEFTLADAMTRLQSFKKTNFDQSVDLALHLGIDSRQAEQQIRGSLSLPHGIGKTKRVVAFCSHEKIEECKAAGAIEAGGEELVKKIDEGWMEFDVAVAEPAMMKVASKLGRSLGPRGLMPSPKSGTVTPQVVDAVKEFGAGKVEFRNDKEGNIHAVVGKMSFDANKLVENAQAFIDQIVKLKPASVKGHYIKNVVVNGTMTPSVKVAI